MSATEKEQKELTLAMNKFIKVSSKAPQSQEVFTKMKGLFEQPAHDFSGMLLNPLMEEFHAAMAPLYSATEPLMADIQRVIFAVLKPLIGVLLQIVQLAGPFIIKLRDLLGLGIPGGPVDPFARFRGWDDTAWFEAGYGSNEVAFEDELNIGRENR